MDLHDRRNRLGDPYRGPDGLVPPWVSVVLTELTPTVADNIVFGLLAWCSEGCPIQRAEQVCMLNRLWPGGRAERGRLFHLFLEVVDELHAGKRAHSKRRAFKPIVIPEGWNPPEPQK